MATVYVETDEWYPVYSVMSKEGWQAGFTEGVPVELTEEELAFVQKADAEFRRAQELIDVKLNQKGA